MGKHKPRASKDAIRVTLALEKTIEESRSRFSCRAFQVSYGPTFAQYVVDVNIPRKQPFDTI